MKKIFTLFAAALMGLAAYAQCPSHFVFDLAEAEQDANNVMVYLRLINSCDYLNGFNMEVEKPAAANWVEDEDDEDWVGFSGYGHTILANWNVSNPNQRETKLFQKADLKCSIKEGNLVIIEILSTLDCRYFPQLTAEDDNIVARFTVDFSACDDSKEPLTLKADNTPSGCTFSYTGDPTGTYNGAIQPEEPVVLELKKADGKISVFTAITEINADNNNVDNRIFDLQGRELSRVPESGIYIQNGKKYVK